MPRCLDIEFDINLTSAIVKDCANERSARRAVTKRLQDMSGYQYGWKLSLFRHRDEDCCEYFFKINNNYRLEDELRKVREIYA